MLINYGKLFPGKGEKIKKIIKFIHKNAANITIRVSSINNQYIIYARKKIDIFMKCLYSNSFIKDLAQKTFIFNIMFLYLVLHNLLLLLLSCWCHKFLSHADIIKNIKEPSWTLHGVMCFWFLLNFLFISVSFDILASLSICEELSYQIINTLAVNQAVLLLLEVCKNHY